MGFICKRITASATSIVFTEVGRYLDVPRHHLHFPIFFSIKFFFGNCVLFINQINKSSIHYSIIIYLLFIWQTICK